MRYVLFNTDVSVYGGYLIFGEAETREDVYEYLTSILRPESILVLDKSNVGLYNGRMFIQEYRGENANAIHRGLRG